jgi:putative transposase
MFSKHTLDAGFGQFLSILKFVCWKRGVYFGKVDKNYTSQVCPQCDAHTGKKELRDRVHSCPECGYTTHRDVAAAQIIRNRGLSEVGRILDNKEIACGDGLAGTRNRLVKSPRSREVAVKRRGFNPPRNIRMSFPSTSVRGVRQSSTKQNLI